MHCGAEHSFFINGKKRSKADKNEVYSTGLNIKGQLGQYNFDNIHGPALVRGLLPHGAKNSKASNGNNLKIPKTPIV